jgi:pyridoxine 5-phosphate synthase
MVRLSVNVDHVATVRNARGTAYPDPVHLAIHALNAGADGITVHLREDRRHIRERDVELLRPLVGMLTLEMAARDEMLAFAKRWRPDLVTLVPERREEITTEGGLDVAGDADGAARAVSELREAGLAVCLFIDPAEEQVRAAAATGAGCVELHTGCYADAGDAPTEAREFAALAEAAVLGSKLGLTVHAGHGLRVDNAPAVAALPAVRELSIGHSIVARALQLGFEGAVREMKEACRV